METNLTFDTFFDFITSQKIVLIDAFAMWCLPCQRFLKLIPRLEETLAGRATFGKFDVDEEPVLKQMYDITKVPTFLFFVNGQLIYRQDGKIMSLAEIGKKVKELSEG